MTDGGQRGNLHYRSAARHRAIRQAELVHPAPAISTKPISSAD